MRIAPGDLGKPVSARYSEDWFEATGRSCAPGQHRLLDQIDHGRERREWWAVQGSNLRHLRCKAKRSTAELTAPKLLPRTLPRGKLFT